MPSTREKHIFKRYCDRCGKMYNPTGRYQKYCEDCKKEIREELNERNRLLKNRKV